MNKYDKEWTKDTPYPLHEILDQLTITQPANYNMSSDVYA